jgi:hypothetical protein
MLRRNNLNVSSFKVRMLQEYVSFENWEGVAMRELGKMQQKSSEQQNTQGLN